MNYFEVWMGDYLRKTMHLDSTEHGAYFMLMVAYYSDEKPLPNDLKKLCRICKAHSQKERDAVSKVLEEFFQLSDDGCYHNSKCDSIIERFRVRAEACSESGKRGGRPRKSNKKPETKSEPFNLEKPNESSLNPKPFLSLSISEFGLENIQSAVASVMPYSNYKGRTKDPTELAVKLSLIPKEGTMNTYQDWYNYFVKLALNER